MPHRKLVTQEESATVSEGEGEGVASEAGRAERGGLWVVRCFIEATLEHSQAPGAYVQACALLPPPSPLFQRKYRAHRHCPRSIPGAKPANFFVLPEQGLTLLTQPRL